LETISLESEPYPWFHITNAFEPDLYKAMLKNLPEDHKYKPHNYYQNRSLFHCEKGFWGEIAKIFIKKYGENILVRLSRDTPGYFIGPHTDKEKMSILYYLAEDESKPHLGTSIYVPKQKGFKCNGRRHHPFEDFKRVKTIPYHPNTGFGFNRCDWSFHGVEKTDALRNVLIVSLNK
jgi:hypothetical protein